VLVEERQRKSAMIDNIGQPNHLKLMRADAALHSIRRLARTASLDPLSRDSLLRTLTEIDLIAKNALREINRESA